MGKKNEENRWDVNLYRAKCVVPCLSSCKPSAFLIRINRIANAHGFTDCQNSDYILAVFQSETYFFQRKEFGIVIHTGKAINSGLTIPKSTPAPNPLFYNKPIFALIPVLKRMEYCP